MTLQRNSRNGVGRMIPKVISIGDMSIFWELSGYLQKKRTGSITLISTSSRLRAEAGKGL
jgi:hypothetical protein